MAGKRVRPGIQKRGSYYYLDKWHKGIRITGSTKTSDYKLAEQILDAKIKEINDALHFGYSKNYTFADAVEKRIETWTHKRTDLTAEALSRLLPFLGHIELRKIHTDHPNVQQFISERQAQGVANSTINRDLRELNTVLKLSATDWSDELTGLPMLNQMPRTVKQLPEKKNNENFKGKESLKPYLLTWEEQGKLLSHMPMWLQRISLFALNTGARDQEICKLKWEQLRIVDGCYVFHIPAAEHKGGRSGKDKFIFTNSVSRSVVDAQKGLDPIWVFPSNKSVISRNKALREGRKPPAGYPVHEITCNGWYKAWRDAGLPGNEQGFNKGVHNLRHTCATRLRKERVNKEDRADILGHESGDITTHYSDGEVVHLCECLEKITKKTDAVFLRRIV